MSEDYVNFVHGLGTDVESLRRERAWLIKRSKTHGLIDEEKKRLRLLGSDDASMSPSLIQPVQAAVDCGEARTPNFRDSKILSIPEKLEMMDLVKLTAIDRAVALGKRSGVVPDGTLERLETEIDEALSKDVSNMEEIQKLINKTKKLLAGMETPDISLRDTRLTVGRWDSEKEEWTTDRPSSGKDVDGSGLTVGRWDADKKKWVK